MTAIDEASPAAQDLQPSLATMTATSESQELDTDSSQLIPTVTDHSQTSPNVPSLNGGQTEPELPADPKVTALLAMFPDFDTSLLQSVLESVAGDQDRAVDVLLGMSDPSYTPSERPDLVRLFTGRLFFSETSL
jgi:CUE domain